MKKTLLAVALTAASMTAVADMSVSGHVNYKAGLLEDFQSNGVSGAGNEDLTVGTAGTSESRFRILSSIEANGLTYATNIELGLGEPGRANALNKRFNEIMVSGAFGKLSLGQGSSAGDGATENDFSGTYLTAGDLTSWELGAGADEIEAGFTLDDAAVGPAVYSANVVTPPGAGLADNNSIDIGRTERLRYDAPTIGNLHLALSINDAAEDDSGNDYALAATYKLPSFVITLASVTKEADDSDVIEASVAGKVNNFTAALGYHTEEFAKYGLDTDKEQTHVILGYNPGPFSVSIDFQTTTIDGVKDLDAETTGLNFVYRPAKGVEVYAGARNAQADNGDIDENAFLMGARVKF
jgi:hypothetical protein